MARVVDLCCCVMQQRKGEERIIGDDPELVGGVSTLSLSIVFEYIVLVVAFQMRLNGTIDSW